MNDEVIKLKDEVIQLKKQLRKLEHVRDDLWKCINKLLDREGDRLDRLKEIRSWFD